LNGIVIFWFLLIAASVTQDILNTTNLVKSRIWIFDLDMEYGVYTWLSSVNLFIASAILGIIGSSNVLAQDRMRFRWLILSVVFFALSIDEHSSIHEKISNVVSQVFTTSGFFNFAWVIPAIAVSIVGLVFYVPFIRTFPPWLRAYLIVSAATFLAGAIGMEMLGGAVAEQGGNVRQSFSYRSLVTIEEALEGGSVILFIAVLVSYGTGIGAIRSPIVPTAR
jgi:hypothetical protein